MKTAHRRRHTNTKGTRQIRRGRTRSQIAALARQLGIPTPKTLACENCDLLIPAHRVEAFGQKVLCGITHLATGDCEPAEYVTVCPECVARDSFEQGEHHD